MTALGDVETQFVAALEDLEKAKQRLAELRRQMPPEPVEDYELRGAGRRGEALSDVWR